MNQESVSYFAFYLRYCEHVCASALRSSVSTMYMQQISYEIS